MKAILKKITIVSVLAALCLNILSGCSRYSLYNNELGTRLTRSDLKENLGVWACEEITLTVEQNDEVGDGYIDITAIVRHDGQEYNLTVTGRDIGIKFMIQKEESKPGEYFWHTAFYENHGNYVVKVTKDESGVTDCAGKIFVLERQK